MNKIIIIYRKDHKKFNMNNMNTVYEVKYTYCYEDVIERQFTKIERANKNFNRNEYKFKPLDYMSKKIQLQMKELFGILIP